MEAGNSPNVIAVTFGRGSRDDAVVAVHVNDQGYVKVSTQYNDLTEANDIASFSQFVFGIEPDAVIIGGFTAETHKLRKAIENILLDKAKQKLSQDKNIAMSGYGGEGDALFESEARAKMIPLIYVRDEVARIYYNSERAQQEFPSWAENTRYALGLARFAQDPLNEYCALGADIASITYVETFQSLVSSDHVAFIISSLIG